MVFHTVKEGGRDVGEILIFAYRGLLVTSPHTPLIR
jgi:hypothetical protein